MKVKQVMTNQVEVLKETNTIKDAAVLMQQQDVGSIPVINDNEEVTGVVTDRDIVIRAVAFDLAPTEPVTNVMTKQVFTCKEDDEAAKAASIMGDHQVRRIPVVDANNKLVGIISLGDLATTELEDAKAGKALSEISEPHSDKDSNPDYGVEIGDFPL